MVIQVANSYQDHPAVSVTHKVWLPSSTVLETSAKHEAAIKEFLDNGAGPLTSTGGDIVGK
jgi:choline dehydrogenase